MRMDAGLLPRLPELRPRPGLLQVTYRRGPGLG